MGMLIKKFKTQSIQCGPGDNILIRGGIYPEGAIAISPSKNSSSWQEGEYNNTLASSPGEWVDTNNLRNGGEGQVDHRPSSPSGFHHIQ